MPPCRTRLPCISLDDPSDGNASLLHNVDLETNVVVADSSPLESGSVAVFDSAEILPLPLALRRIRELEKATTQLTHELKVCTQRNAHLKASADVIQAAFDNDLICPICREQLITPFTLRACGHAFCFPCLRMCFVSAISDLANNDDNRHRIPRRLRRFDPLKATPLHLNKLRRLITPEVQYQCPFCRRAISPSERPIRSPLAQNLITAITKATQVLNPPDDDVPVVTALIGTWDGLFCP